MAHSEKPDLILVTESWCNTDITDAFLSIDGYELQTDLRMDRDDTARGRGGGLLVYAKTGIQLLKIDNQVNVHQCSSFLVHDITVHLVYRSTNAHPEAMNDLIRLVRSVKKNSVLIGDFNLPDIDWETGGAAARSAGFLEAVEDMYMVQMVDFATQIKETV